MREIEGETDRVVCVFYIGLEVLNFYFYFSNAVPNDIAAPAAP